MGSEGSWGIGIVVSQWRSINFMLEGFKVTNANLAYSRKLYFWAKLGAYNILGFDQKGGNSRFSGGTAAIGVERTTKVCSRNNLDPKKAIYFGGERCFLLSHLSRGL
jgi:hypothetical protein